MAEEMDKKAAKKAEKARKKAEKKAAKNMETDLENTEEEEGSSSKLAVALVTLVIIIVWLAILTLLIKWDVGGFGSTVMRPLLKDIPYVNRILPDSEDDLSTEEEYPYKNMDEAVAYIKELERLKTQESRLVDKYVDGKISDEIYDKKYSEIQNQIVRIEKLLVPVEENEDLKDIQEVIDNLDQEIDEWIKTEDFEENKADFIIEHVKQIKVMHDKHIIIYLDLVGGAIIAGKNFLLFVSESMPFPHGRVCFKRHGKILWYRGAV